MGCLGEASAPAAAPPIEEAPKDEVPTAADCEEAPTAASATAPPAAPASLAEQPPDVLWLLGGWLFDALTPGPLLVLSSTSKAVRQALESVLAELREERLALRSILARGDKTFDEMAAFSGAVIRWGSRRLSDGDCRLMGRWLFGRGAMAQLRELHLRFNQIGDAGLAALAQALGGLPRLETLSLNNNRVGDAGLAALARACAHDGALRSLEALFLNENQIGDAGLAAFAAGARGGGLARLTLLLLDANAFGAAGVRALAAAGAHGALPKLTTLYLSGNAIGEPGTQSLAAALAGGALPELQRLCLDQLDRGLLAACAARGVAPVRLHHAFRPSQGRILVADGPMQANAT